MSAKKKFPPLGRGLDSLIPVTEVTTEGSSTISEVPLTQIEPNTNQPRRDFDEQALQQLAESIRQIGIISPITLRQTAPQRYQIIAGERRWRAAQRAGLQTIPAYIRTTKDEDVMQMALVENIQREDLNPIEIALAYAQLTKDADTTQDQIAKRVGKSRAEVANYLRLLKLPAPIQIALQKKELSMGHARALLAIEDAPRQINVYKEIQQRGYSVRQVENIVRGIKQAAETAPTPENKAAQALAEQYDILTKKMSQFLQTTVQLNISKKGKGKITIPFDNEDELLHIMTVLDTLRKP